MPTEISIYACDDSTKAAAAKLVLVGLGFPAANITVEQTNVLIYDAQMYDGGKTDTVYGKFVVIGRKKT